MQNSKIVLFVVVVFILFVSFVTCSLLSMARIVEAQTNIRVDIHSRIVDRVFQIYPNYKTAPEASSKIFYKKVTTKKTVTPKKEVVEEETPTKVEDSIKIEKATTTKTTSTPVVATPPVTETVPQKEGKVCFNYGHQKAQSSGAYYDLKEGGQTDKDLSLFEKNGIKCLRVAYSYHNDSNTKALAKYINDRGFYVIFGGDDYTLRMEDLKTYNARVLEAARWAEQEDIDQFSLGNEQEYRLNGISVGAWIANLKVLSNDVKKVYGGVVSYEFSGDYLDQYIAGGKGSIDKYGINSYCCWENFAKKATTAWGSNGFYFGEFNVDRKFLTFKNDEDWAKSLAAALNEIKDYSFPVYFFTFRDGGYEMPYGMWSIVRNDDSLVTPVASILGIKK